jgi:hypothetical protein
MKKRIIIDKQTMDKIIKVFKVSKESVYSALRFQTRSDLSNKIRVMALKNGGKVFGEIEIKKRDE